MKMFCFTYAGGNGNFFNGLKKEVSAKGLELVALDYPGHGTRRKEAFETDFYGLSLDLLSKMKSMLDIEEEYALMGYSMGSITATEIVKRIMEEEVMCEPQHVFLAAHEPKTLRDLENIPDDMQDDVLKERTISFGAVPEELVDNQTFWRMYMPLYKADYRMIGRYDFGTLNLSTDIRTTILYSQTDTPYEEMDKWRKYYKGDIKFYKFEGNHFFIKEHEKEIAEIILERLPAD